MGYNISLAISVNKLTNDKIQTVRVMFFKVWVCLDYVGCQFECVILSEFEGQEQL